MFTGMRHRGKPHQDVISVVLDGKNIRCPPAGIVQGQGRVSKVHQQQDFRSVDIEFPRASMAGIQIGASVAINGTCLTVLSSFGMSGSLYLQRLP